MNKLTKFAFVALIFFAVSTTMQASRRLSGRRRGVIYHVPPVALGAFVVAFA